MTSRRSFLASLGALLGAWAMPWRKKEQETITLREARCWNIGTIEEAEKAKLRPLPPLRSFTFTRQEYEEMRVTGELLQRFGIRG